MTNANRRLWLIVALLLVVTIALRQLRAPTVVAIVVIGIAVLWVAFAVLTARRSGARAPLPPATKNVTPVEPVLGEGRISPPPAARDVVILDPADASAKLAERLDALDRLRADGVVSESEYEAKRAQLIAEF